MSLRIIVHCLYCLHDQQKQSSMRKIQIVCRLQVFVIYICVLFWFKSILKDFKVRLVRLPVAQMVEHGASNAKIMGSIPRESKSWSKVKTVTWMQCKSLWIKASAKCINVNVNVNFTCMFSTCFYDFYLSVSWDQLATSLASLYYSRLTSLKQRK